MHNESQIEKFVSILGAATWISVSALHTFQGFKVQQTDCSTWSQQMQWNESAVSSCLQKFYGFYLQKQQSSLFAVI